MQETIKPSENLVTASIQEMIRLRYAARELSNFPNLLARQATAGGHRSRFRGRGMDFDEVRIYQPGDDVRTIDWRVTARTQIPHTKVFTEERERPILVICDLRGSMFFGSQRLKSVVACEISAALAWAGIAANDRAGGLVFGQQRQVDIKSQRSHHAVLQYIHALRDFSAELLEIRSERYSLAEILEESRRFVLPGSTLFIVSDFYDFDRACHRHLFELARHGNLNLCHVFDPLEAELPPPSVYAVSDGESQILLDSRSTELRRHYAVAYQKRCDDLRAASERLAAGLLSFSTAENVFATLGRAYGKRHSRTRR